MTSENQFHNADFILLQTTPKEMQFSSPCAHWLAQHGGNKLSGRWVFGIRILCTGPEVQDPDIMTLRKKIWGCLSIGEARALSPDLLYRVRALDYMWALVSTEEMLILNGHKKILTKAECQASKFCKMTNGLMLNRPNKPSKTSWNWWNAFFTCHQS